MFSYADWVSFLPPFAVYKCLYFCVSSAAQIRSLSVSSPVCWHTSVNSQHHSKLLDWTRMLSTASNRRIKDERHSAVLYSGFKTFAWSCDVGSTLKLKWQYLTYTHNTSHKDVAAAAPAHCRSVFSTKEAFKHLCSRPQNHTVRLLFMVLTVSLRSQDHLNWVQSKSEQIQDQIQVGSSLSQDIFEQLEETLFVVYIQRICSTERFFKLTASSNRCG